MGKDKKKQQQATTQQLQDVNTQATNAYNRTQQPSPLENEMGPISQNYNDLFNKTSYRQMEDYGDIMGGYRDFGNSLSPSFSKVNYKRPGELDESYGFLREAAPGYREFANTGGYSNQDIQELRARGTSPIRAAYGNSMMELNRARAIGGDGGSPNYIAALSKAQREQPGQMADAMTNVNAKLAEDIREGKLAGLGGLANIGSTMGGLSSDEAGRELSAQMANQNAELQARSMYNSAKLGSLQGQTGLYGTTPAMANMFGNQVMNAYGLRGNLESQRNNQGISLLASRLSGINSMQDYLNQNKTQPWWKTALSVGGTVAPYLAQYYAGKNGGSIPMSATDIGGEPVY